jgi:hypothetical protein
VVIGIGSIIVFWLVASLFLKGGAWLGEVLYPWLSRIFGVVFWVFVLILLPLALFRKTRSFSSTSIYVASFIFGAYLWITSFLITYDVWGLIAVIIGLFIVGIGVIPIAMLASLLHGEWSTLGQLILLLILTMGSRILGIRLEEKATRQLWDNEGR